MNAIPQQNQLPDEKPVDGSSVSALSALADSELLPGELDDLFASLETRSAHSSWYHYHLIGDVLRGTSPGPVSEQSSQVFLAAFRARLDTDASVVVPSAGPVETGVVESESKRPVAGKPALNEGRAKAANDAVFRWKMVAGFASMAAVVAVTGSLLGTSPVTQGVPGAGGQMAMGSQSGNALPDEGGSAPIGQQQVVVNTPQGPVLRDLQLESLMAQHRQYGDMSALQMPSGFLRNATYDTPSR